MKNEDLKKGVTVDYKPIGECVIENDQGAERLLLKDKRGNFHAVERSEFITEKSGDEKGGESVKAESKRGRKKKEEKEEPKEEPKE